MRVSLFQNGQFCRLTVRRASIYSIIDFLNPEVLGPLFRFNREFYQFDDRGRPAEFSNLGKLRDRVAPLMLRRRKAQVETELPERTDREYLVPLGELQMEPYGYHENQVFKLVNIAQRRPLTQQEREKLMRELNMARMTCDTNYINPSHYPIGEWPKQMEIKNPAASIGFSGGPGYLLPRSSRQGGTTGGHRN